MLGIGRCINVLLQYFGSDGTIMSFSAAWPCRQQNWISHREEVAMHREGAGAPDTGLEFTRYLTKLTHPHSCNVIHTTISVVAKVWL
jgi:hypothetical protein